MATYTDNCIESKLNEDVLEATAGKRDSVSPYQSPELSSRLMKKTSKENSAAEYDDIKKLLE
jgi:hypothetical protein